MSCASSLFRPVVRAKQNKRVVPQSDIIANQVEQNSQLLIHRIKDSVIKCPFRFIATPSLRRKERRMNIVRPDVDIKRFAVSHRLLDEFNGCCSERLGNQ